MKNVLTKPKPYLLPREEKRKLNFDEKHKAQQVGEDKEMQKSILLYFQGRCFDVNGGVSMIL